MKTNKKLLLLTLITILVLSISVTVFAAYRNRRSVTKEPSTKVTETTTTNITLEDSHEEATNDETYGSVGSFNVSDYTLEDMLIYALQDEYLAKAEYAFIQEEFNVTNPFSNIEKSEDTHIALLLPLFEKYDIEPIENTAFDHLISIESLQEAFETGVVAEINNIQMYENFLETDLPDDVRDAFIKLMNASKNHLKAFERGASKY